MLSRLLLRRHPTLRTPPPRSPISTSTPIPSPLHRRQPLSEPGSTLTPRLSSMRRSPPSSPGPPSTSTAATAATGRSISAEETTATASFRCWNEVGLTAQSQTTGTRLHRRQTTFPSEAAALRFRTSMEMPDKTRRQRPTGNRQCRRSIATLHPTAISSPTTRSVAAVAAFRLT